MNSLCEVTDTGQFESLREEWDDLLRASASDCVFLTWEWLFTWWRCLSGGRNLCLLVVRENGLLTAIAPLALRSPDLARFLPLPSVEFLGTGAVGSDYLDIIVRRGCEETALSLISKWAENRGRILALSQLQSRSRAAHVAESLREQGWSVAAEKTNVCPYIDLAGHTWDTYLDTRSANHRYSVRRQIRKLERQSHLELECVESESTRKEALDRLWRLHRARWDPRGGSDALRSPAVMRFHEEFTRLALGHGWLRLSVLRVDGVAVAALYGLRYGRSFLFYQSGFDPAYSRQSIGMITLALVIQRAILEGAAEFDMLHGNESYKLHWATSSRDLTRLEAFPPHVAGQVSRGGLRLNRWSRKMARALLSSVASAGRAAAFNRERKSSYAAHTD